MTGGNFSPFVTADSAIQQLIVSKQDGSLSLLKQDLLSQQWRQQPFYIPNLDKNLEYDGFMTRIAITADHSGRRVAR